MKLNRKEILRHIRAIERQILDNKGHLGYDHRGREFSVAARMSDLAACRREITILYTLVAHVRNKVHQQRMSFEEQEKWLLDRRDQWIDFLEKKMTLVREAA